MKYKLFFKLFFMLILWFATMNQASAQHMMGHHGGADSLHRNHTGLFLGATKENASDANTSFTLGIHHEMFARSRTPYINVGIMGEVIFAGDNEFLAAIPIYFHPAPMLKFWIGPGVRASTHSDKNNIDNNIDNYDDSMMGNWQSDFMVRIGGAYEFHFDEYTVSPTISADILNHRTYLVFGIVFGLSY